MAQKNGGGAFLVPYFIMLFLQGLPIFYLELAIGQRLRKGAIGVWNEVSPYLGGIGISSAIVSFIVALYYNTIIAWCLIYFLHSFEDPLPWAECPKKFIKSNMSYYYEKECNVSRKNVSRHVVLSKTFSFLRIHHRLSSIGIARPSCRLRVLTNRNNSFSLSAWR